MICSYNGALCTILSRGHCAKSGKRDQGREMRAAVTQLPVHLAGTSHSALTLSRQAKPDIPNNCPVSLGISIYPCGAAALSKGGDVNHDR
jgi:hypothetical protein